MTTKSLANIIAEPSLALRQHDPQPNLAITIHLFHTPENVQINLRRKTTPTHRCRIKARKKSASRLGPNLNNTAACHAVQSCRIRHENNPPTATTQNLKANTTHNQIPRHSLARSSAYDHTQPPLPPYPITPTGRAYNCLPNAASTHNNLVELGRSQSNARSYERTPIATSRAPTQPMQPQTIAKLFPSPADQVPTRFTNHPLKGSMGRRSPNDQLWSISPLQT